MFPTKLLLATDGSAEAGSAARMAMTLSEGLDSELHAVLVGLMPDPIAWPETTIVDPDLWEVIRERSEMEARERLDAELEKLEGLGVTVADARARTGRADAEIVAAAEEMGAGLVVVGSRGLGSLRRAVMGSVSDSVVRHAHCPVLVARTRDGDALDGAHPPAPMVLAIDGSKEADTAARAAAEISQGIGSPVHLIYVLPIADRRLFGPHPYSEETKKSLLEQARADARGFLEERAEGLRSAGGTVAQTYLGTGRPDAEIVELAEEIGAGLIVIGSRGLGGVRRELLGSVSGSVVKHAHCPVLVVRGVRRDEDATARRAEETTRG